MGRPTSRAAVATSSKLSGPTSSCKNMSAALVTRPGQQPCRGLRRQADDVALCSTVRAQASAVRAATGWDPTRLQACTFAGRPGSTAQPISATLPHLHLPPRPTPPLPLPAPQRSWRASCGAGAAGSGMGGRVVSTLQPASLTMRQHECGSPECAAVLKHTLPHLHSS